MSEVQLQLSGAFERDKALEALRNKYQSWIDCVGAPTLYRLCQRMEFFTTDDLWEELGGVPSHIEKRVLGSLMRGFALKGYIKKTGVTEKSRLRVCHARDKALWQSTLYKGVDVL